MNWTVQDLLPGKGLNTLFNPKDCLIRKGKTIIAHGHYERKIPVFQTRSVRPVDEATALYIERDPMIWHERFGHIRYKAPAELPKTTIGCEFDRPIKIDDCDIYFKAKMTAKISREPSKQAIAFNSNRSILFYCLILLPGIHCSLLDLVPILPLPFNTSRLHTWPTLPGRLWNFRTEDSRISHDEVFKKNRLWATKKLTPGLKANLSIQRVRNGMYQGREFGR